MMPLRRLVLLIATLAALSLAAGCAALPPRGEVAASHALADTASTALARIAAASRPAGETAASGFQLLPTGEFAFNARIALVRQAERTLDMQTYHLQRDHAGRTLLRELRDAARRGVRVRLLVDDFYAAEIDDLLAALATEPNAEVRLFNPLALRRGTPLLRLALSPGDFERHNHRMHNKLFVADNAVALYGGRNIADEYFMSHPQANFIDMDLLSAGAIVPALSAVFDRYWNSDAAWPLQRVLGAPGAADAAALRAAFDDAVRDAAPAVPGYGRDPLGQPPVEAQLAAGRLQLSFAEAQVFADPPEKALQPAGREPTAAMAGLLQALGTARREVSIASPYFLPNAAAMDQMREARRHGVKLRVVTNSIASTDEPLVHWHYSRRRAELLRLGVELYEFSPALTQRSLRFGSFGRSIPRLHAKVAVVDGRRLLVGSVNLDARSAIGNTEMGVVIDSPLLASQLLQLIAGPRVNTMLRLQLAADGERVQWLMPGAGDAPPTVLHDEPGLGAAQRLLLWLQSLAVDENLL